MISLPEALLGEIDRAALERRQSRSGLLREAAVEYLTGPNRAAPGEDPAIRAAHDALARLAERARPASGVDSLELLRRLRNGSQSGHGPSSLGESKHGPESQPGSSNTWRTEIP